MMGNELYKPRVDFLVLHWYERDPYAFLDFVDYQYSLYKIPVWITEFSIANWNAGTSNSKPLTSAEIIEFITISVSGLEYRPFVDRYSWYSNPCDIYIKEASLWSNFDGQCLGNLDETLTEFGILYYNITKSTPPTINPSKRPTKMPYSLKIKNIDYVEGTEITANNLIIITVILGVFLILLFSFIIYKKYL
jgi:hypothetical protein